MACAMGRANRFGRTTLSTKATGSMTGLMVEAGSSMLMAMSIKVFEMIRRYWR